MLRVAIDSGFEVKDNQVIDMIGFMYYLNKHSYLPFMYKYRSIKGKYEYFIKAPEMYVHIKTTDINVDDGEREGQLMNNYIVDMTSTLRFPVPLFYAYYSLDIHEFAKHQKMDGTYSFYELCASDIPKVNNKGWNQYMTTEYLDDEDNYKAKNPVKIDLSELFTGELIDLINYTKSIFISPSVFIDIKLYNNCTEIDTKMDWSTCTLSTTKAVDDLKSIIVIYTDLKYANEQKINLQKLKDSRINNSK
jgi:hypothetical protein